MTDICMLQRQRQQFPVGTAQSKSRYHLPGHGDLLFDGIGRYERKYEKQSRCCRVSSADQVDGTPFLATDAERLTPYVSPPQMLMPIDTTVPRLSL